jgi:hypothetical protein
MTFSWDSAFGTQHLALGHGNGGETREPSHLPERLKCQLPIAQWFIVWLSCREPLCALCRARYNRLMPVFQDKQEELEHYETMMGVPRGRLAVTMDSITDAMALVGQHGVYCQSQRWPGKPVMDIQIIMKNLTDAKELIQSVMEELKTSR